MSNDWNGEGGRDDREPSEHRWSPELSFGDPDAWRNGEPGEWDTFGALWRGDQHPPDWPEWIAGPEYLMWKRLAEGE